MGSTALGASASAGTLAISQSSCLFTCSASSFYTHVTFYFVLILYFIYGFWVHGIWCHDMIVFFMPQLPGQCFSLRDLHLLDWLKVIRPCTNGCTVFYCCFSDFLQPVGIDCSNLGCLLFSISALWLCKRQGRGEEEGRVVQGYNEKQRRTKHLEPSLHSFGQCNQQ